MKKFCVGTAGNHSVVINACGYTDALLTVSVEQTGLLSPSVLSVPGLSYGYRAVVANITGYTGFSGDGFFPLTAVFKFPAGMAFDSNGNFYITDNSNNCIREVAATTGTQYGQSMQAGYIYTAIGNGIASSAGDGGPASSARVNAPSDVVFDSVGNLLIAEYGSGKIRIVAGSTGTYYGISMAAGNIYTIAGTGTAGYSGDGGLAASAQMKPKRLALDSKGNIFILEPNNYRVRVISATTGLQYGVSMVAGNIYTVAGIGGPGYTGDTGPATRARLSSNASDIAIDSLDNLYISDMNNNCVRRVDANGIITTVAGTGTSGSNGDNGLATNAQLNSPNGIKFDRADNLYIGSNGGNNVRKVDSNGIIRTVVNASDQKYTQYSSGYTFLNAQKMTFDDLGNLYIADNSYSRVIYVQLVDVLAPTWPNGSALTITNATPTGLTLNWTAATDDVAVTAYKIYENGSVIATVSGVTTYNVTGLTADIPYTYQVQAGDASGNWSTNGPTVVPFDTAAPTWPQGSALTITQKNQTGLTLTWTAANDDVGVTAYSIYENGSAIGNVSGVTSYDITGLTAGTTYTFQVQAGDASGKWSTDGPVTSARTVAASGDITAPAWPSGSSLTPSNVSQYGLTLTWSDATDDVGVTGYNIYQGASLIKSMSAATHSYEITGLTPGITYSFKVEAGDDAYNWSTNGPSTTTTTTALANGSAMGVYTMTPSADADCTNGKTAYGIDTITVNSGVTGSKDFTITVTPVTAHLGNEKAVFAQLRNGALINLTPVTADFDSVNTATVSFNVQPGDVIKVFIVDDLTSAADVTTTILEE